MQLGSVAAAEPGVGIRALSAHPYRLPLSRPWDSARGVFEERRGWLVSAHSEGVVGYGDCAPLPEAGTEPPDHSSQSLTHWQTRLRGIGIDEALSLLADTPANTPSAHYALECALLDLQSRINGISLRHAIGAALGAGVPNWVPVNCALGALGSVGAEDVAQACEAGFSVLKLKVGLDSPDRELERLAETARLLPAGVRLRLDANGAWDLKTAARVIAALDGLPVESVEEPLTAPEPNGLARLQALAAFSLALDESLPRLLRQLDPEHLPVRRAVLKPAVIGGLRATRTLAKRLQGAGTEVVLTSLVESAAGLWPTAQLAAAIGGPLHHGLDTARWLAADLGPVPLPSAGRILLPDEPGSGFHPHAPGGNHA